MAWKNSIARFYCRRRHLAFMWAYEIKLFWRCLGLPPRVVYTGSLLIVTRHKFISISIRRVTSTDASR